MDGDRADEHFLRRALRLAARGRYGVGCNPMVGAVVVREGRIVGEGYHAQRGGPHAETEALRAAGEAARGATLYVNLEPCNHEGATPPCTKAILEAGIRRVVLCHRDPNRQVAGGGAAVLSGRGLRVDSGLLADEARRLNLHYVVRHVLERPAITLKWAMSLDGRVATRTGESQWISGPPSRRLALDLRESHDAILVGSGTLLADDPRLNRRRQRAEGPILRVILDRRLRTPPAARLFSIAGPVLLYTAGGGESRRRRMEVLRERGATVVVLPQVEPVAVVADLARRGVGSLLVEGGSTVAGAFAAAGLYDRVCAVVAPLLIGGHAAPGPLGGSGSPHLAAAPRLEGLRTGRRGPDVVLEGLREGCLRELSANAPA